jgi:hypothetical protein
MNQVFHNSVILEHKESIHKKTQREYVYAFVLYKKSCKWICHLITEIGLVLFKSKYGSTD